MGLTVFAQYFTELPVLSISDACSSNNKAVCALNHLGSTPGIRSTIANLKIKKLKFKMLKPFSRFS